MTATASVNLGALLDILGAEVVRALALPLGREVPIGSPTVYDPGQTPATLVDAVLLVPGGPTIELLNWAASQRVAAVVLREGSADAGPLIEESRRAGVALLECSQEMPWGELYTLIDALLAVTGPASQPDSRHAADLYSLANDTALRAGGAVAIEDLSMRVLAYSTIPGQEVDDQRRDGILGRRVPEHPANAEEYGNVLRSETAVWSTKPSEYRPRLAIAIRDGGEALGSIWVLQGAEPLAAEAPEVLAECARLAAPHLVRLNLAADAERRQLAERLGWLLRGLRPPQELADSSGLRFDEPATVLVVGRVGVHPDHPRGVSVESAAAKVGDLLRIGLSAYRLRATAGSFNGQAVAVVGTVADAPVLQLVTSTVLARAADILGGGWRAGISRTQENVSDVPTGLTQATQALGVVCGPFGQGDIGRYDQLAASLFLLDLYRAMRFRPTLDAEPLALVLDHDIRHGTDYVKTLRSWIMAQYDIPRAAEALVVHPNTLRHRLRRLAEVIDIDDPDLRLALALQLRLREIRTKPVD